MAGCSAWCPRVICSTPSRLSRNCIPTNPRQPGRRFRAERGGGDRSAAGLTRALDAPCLQNDRKLRQVPSSLFRAKNHNDRRIRPIQALDREARSRKTASRCPSQGSDLFGTSGGNHQLSTATIDVDWSDAGSSGGCGRRIPCRLIPNERSVASG